MRASGQIGGSQVYATWRGVTYARQLVDPANPRTTEQLNTRTVFRFLQALYRALPAQITQIWDDLAAGRPITDRNAFTKANLPELRTATNLQGLTLSSGTGNAPPPINVSITTGPPTAKITVSADAPQLPTGWTNGPWYVTALKDQDPHEYLEDAVGFWSYVAGANFSDHITVQEAQTDYSVGIIHEYTDHRGNTVWSADIRAIVQSS